MKKFLSLLFILPIAGFSQCPQWINEPVKNSMAFMSLMEQRLSFKFTDSSVTPARDRMVFNDKAGQFVVKIGVKNDRVSDIYFEAPNQSMSEFMAWFEKEFAECAESKKEETWVFADCVVMTKALGESKRVFYIDAK